MLLKRLSMNLLQKKKNRRSLELSLCIQRQTKPFTKSIVSGWRTAIGIRSLSVLK